MQRSALCRSRRELLNAYFLAKFGFDTAENEPCEVCPAVLSIAVESSAEQQAHLCELREVAEVVALHFVQEPADCAVLNQIVCIFAGSDPGKLPFSKLNGASFWPFALWGLLRIFAIEFRKFSAKLILSEIFQKLQL